MTGGSSGARQPHRAEPARVLAGICELARGPRQRLVATGDERDHVAGETKVDDTFAVDRAERPPALVLECREPHSLTDACAQVKPVSLGIAPPQPVTWSCIIGRDGAAVNIRSPAGSPSDVSGWARAAAQLEQFR